MREPPNPIDVELAAERAAALGKSGRKLRAALDKLRQFDAGEWARAGRPETLSRPDGTARKELVELAGEAFWFYVLHRESVGLYDEDAIARDYGIPPDVRKHMGPRMRKPAR